MTVIPSGDYRSCVAFFFMKKVLFLFSDGIMLSQSPVNGYYKSLYLDHGGTLFWSDERLKKWYTLRYISPVSPLCYDGLRGPPNKANAG